MISIELEWFKTPKPISGMGWDGIGLDGIRVVGGIEHLTVLIRVCSACLNIKMHHVQIRETEDMGMPEASLSFFICLCPRHNYPIVSFSVLVN